MNIALFGGAFDPPHIGHKTVAEELVSKHIVDEVWFVPVFTHPWADRYNKRTLVDYDLRVAMLDILVKSTTNPEIQKKLKVAHFKSVSFTYDTLQFFAQQYPNYTFSWVMGSEYLNRFDDFLKVHPLLLEYTFYIYPRLGHPLSEDQHKKNMIFLEKMPEIAVSSTEVKKCLHEKTSVDSLLPPSVISFIKKNKLYTE